MPSNVLEIETILGKTFFVQDRVLSLFFFQ